MIIIQDGFKEVNVPGMMKMSIFIKKMLLTSRTQDIILTYIKLLDEYFIVIYRNNS